MSADRVEAALAGGVLTVTLNRPDKRNAIDSMMVEALLQSLERAELDAAVRVVAVVHGRAIAGGCGLATACDLVLARADAQLGYPEVRRGFVPAMVMAMLRRIAGEKVAFDLVATGRLLSAEEARGLGLVSRVLPAGTFEQEVAGVLTGLAGSSPTALALIKRQLYELDGRTFEEGIRLGAEVNALARTTPDFRTAIAAFLMRSPARKGT